MVVVPSASVSAVVVISVTARTAIPTARMVMSAAAVPTIASVMVMTSASVSAVGNVFRVACV